MIRKIPPQLERFSPELNRLKEITQATIEENLSHATEVINSKEPLTKVIGKEIGRAIVQGPSKMIEKVEEVSEPLRSMAEKTVEIIAEQSDPISKKVTEVLKAHAEINPVNVVNKTEEVVKTYAKTASESVDDIGKEITKTVIKEKAIAVKQSFWNKIVNIFKKIKNFFVKQDKKVNIS